MEKQRYTTLISFHFQVYTIFIFKKHGLSTSNCCNNFRSICSGSFHGRGKCREHEQNLAFQAAYLRRRAATQLSSGNPAPFFALVGISLASGSGVITKQDELDCVCAEIRRAAAKTINKSKEPAAPGIFAKICFRLILPIRISKAL